MNIFFDIITGYMSIRINKRAEKIKLKEFHAGILPKVMQFSNRTEVTFSNELIVESVIPGQASKDTIIKPITLRNLVFLFCDPHKIEMKRADVIRTEGKLPKTSAGYTRGAYESLPTVKAYQSAVNELNNLIQSLSKNGDKPLFNFLGVLEFLNKSFADVDLKEGAYELKHHQTSLKNIPEDERLPNLIELVMLSMALLKDGKIPEGSSFWFPSDTKDGNKNEKRYCVEVSNGSGVSIIETNYFDDPHTPKTFVHNVLTLKSNTSQVIQHKVPTKKHS